MDNFELIFAGLAVLYYFFIELPRKARQKKKRREAHIESIAQQKKKVDHPRREKSTVSAFEKSIEQKRVTSSQTGKQEARPAKYEEARPAKYEDAHPAKYIETNPKKHAETPTSTQDSRPVNHAEDNLGQSENAISLPISDLRSAVMMNEILTPPVSLR
jgi:hypothetical protein